MVKEIDSKNFEQEVLKSDKPVLVDFFALWCQPCLSFLPIIEQIEKEVGSQYKIVKLNVDDNPDIAKEYKVKTIPNFTVFKDGKVHKIQIGRAPKETILKLFE